MWVWVLEGERVGQQASTEAKTMKMFNFTFRPAPTGTSFVDPLPSSPFSRKQFKTLFDFTAHLTRDYARANLIKEIQSLEDKINPKFFKLELTIGDGLN